MMGYKKNLIKKLCYAVALSFLISGEVGAQAVQDTAGRAEIETAAEQTAGNNPVQKLDYINAYGMQQKAWNSPLEHLGEGQSRPGYSKYVWKKDLVLPIRLREGMMTLINFPSWEVIEEVWVGSSEAFRADIASSNSLMLGMSPDIIGVDSNMIVFGRSGNRYAFYLRSEGYNTERITHSVVDVSVSERDIPAGVLGVKGSSTPAGKAGGTSVGGATIASAVATNAPINWLENIATNPEAFRFDIDVFVPNPADVGWAPDRVWRDDIFTYIDLGKRALSSNERPIVNLLVQESETPVGFRTRGPHGRLIIVEAVGDMVLRNGRRLICLKLRKDPSYGLDLVEYAPQKGPVDMGGGYKGEIPATKVGSPNTVKGAGELSKEGVVAYESYKKADTMKYLYEDQDKSYTDVYDNSNIALELGTSEEISELEALWDKIYKTNTKTLSGIEPYFSVDAKIEDGKELFHLRAGPIKEIPFGEHVCVVLGKAGFKCSVIRTQ